MNHVYWWHINAYRLANNEDLDEITHFTRVYTVCYLHDKKGSSEKEMQSYLEIISCDPTIYMWWTIPKLVHHIRRKNLLSAYWVKTNRMPQNWRNFLTLYLLVSTKTVLDREQGLTFLTNSLDQDRAQQSHRAWSGSKLFDTEGIPDLFVIFLKKGYIAENQKATLLKSYRITQHVNIYFFWVDTWFL